MLILLCTVEEKQVVYKRLERCCRLHCVNI